MDIGVCVCEVGIELISEWNGLAHEACSCVGQVDIAVTVKLPLARSAIEGHVGDLLNIGKRKEVVFRIHAVCLGSFHRFLCVKRGGTACEGFRFARKWTRRRKQK